MTRRSCLQVRDPSIRQGAAGRERHNDSGWLLGRRLGREEELVMDERDQPQGTSGGEPDHGSDVPDEARVTKLHRDGEVEPELDERSEGPGAKA